jgi:hypothetical protein
MTGKKGETPPNEALMPDRGQMFPEPAVQASFSFSEAFQLLAFVLLLFVVSRVLETLPDRVERGHATTRLNFVPVQLDGWQSAHLTLVGAWRLRSKDPRFGGFSALALDGDRLLTVTDNGVLAWLPRPGMAQPTISMRELPDGPGAKQFDFSRDSESLAADPLGRGWWVSFEMKHELWLYDPTFTNALKRVRLGAGRWPPNAGIEGLLALPGPQLIMFVENGARLFQMRNSIAQAQQVRGVTASISEAAVLPGGRLAVIERSFGATGFRNSVAILARGELGLEVVSRYPLLLGPLDNVEGLAAERGPNGGTRLWMITDDNFQRPLRTLLLAVDLPPERNDA